MKVLFVEPPKDIWFIMGDYLPPPYGIIQVAAYLERELPDVEVEVLDCNARELDWDGLKEYIEASSPDIVASSSLSTCNTYEVARTLQVAKKVSKDIFTVTGGIHFSFTAQESLKAYREIDAIVRGEGEATFVELVNSMIIGLPLIGIPGLTFRQGKKVYHGPDRLLVEDLESLPFPGYHLVKDHMDKYHFAAMGGKDAPFALVEGGRGCPHKCIFCTQWRYWCGEWRVKSPSRIADEMECIYKEYGSRFIWLTDDNFGPGDRAEELADELLKRDMPDLMWFVQMRCDDVVRIKDALPKMRKSGLQWVMMGVESPTPEQLEIYRKGIEPSDAMEAVRLLKENDIFTHCMFIIGDRGDTHESIEHLRGFVNKLDPDFVIYTVLTPFPGTDVYDDAKEKGWIEDDNLFNYDMAHAIMPTETLTRMEVQEELYRCYNSFYGSWGRRIKGMTSSNELKRRINWYMAGRGILVQLKSLIK
ncbi:MAG: B12-binding domain-containing radical SAM protein [Candidatus Bathyarchaeota archaeon]|nr:B12-binding domain-containing radical SAM protein [Candidatus Bathyarchaeota archaeon]